METMAFTSSYSTLTLKATLTSKTKPPQTSTFSGSLSRQSKIVLARSSSIARSLEIDTNGSGVRGVALEGEKCRTVDLRDMRNDTTTLKEFQISESKSLESDRYFGDKNSLLIQVGALLATIVAEPAIAVTGVNREIDWATVLTEGGIVAFGYFLVMPPIIMNWMRIRWYRRNLLEMYFQFMFVFLFFPGVLLWAPFLNFRKFPRDPNMKYPWSKTENPDEIKGGFRKYPWASIEDYE